MRTAIFLGMTIALASLLATPCAAADKKKADLKIGKKYLVIVNDGRVLIGTLAKQDKVSITIEDRNNKKTNRILRKDIERIVAADTKKAQVWKELKRKLEAARRRKLAAQQRRIIVRQQRGSDSPAARDSVDPKDPKVRLLLLSPKGPLLADVSIYADGKPFRMLREAVVDGYIKLADPKQNGKPAWEILLKRMGRIPPASRQNLAKSNDRLLANYIGRYDLNGDKLVDRYEVRRMIAQLGYGPAFNVQPTYAYYAQPDVKDLLDTNGDDKLSKSEIAAAARRLKSRDGNDNDLIEAEELGGGRRNGQRGVRLPTRGQAAYPIDERASLSSIFFVLQLRYGGKEKKIARKAFQLAPRLFDELDLNGNGLLEGGEVVGLHLAKPQLDVQIRIGKSNSKTPNVQVKSTLKKSELKIAVDQSDARTVSLGFPGWKLRLNVPNVSPRTNDYSRTAANYLQRYDADKNGYIDAKDIKQLGNQGRVVERQMNQWDVNADGKVFAKEIEAYYDRQQAPRRSQIVMSVADQGPSLFAALDVSGDNRLSLREMRTAGERLRKLDRNENGVIDPDEMPGETVLSFTQGRSAFQRAGYGQRGRQASPRSPRGPKWFIHMDRNGDGDITLREFLGTKAQFAKLDTNKDGFIEPKEAESAGGK